MYAVREAFAAFRRAPVLTGLAAGMVGLALFVLGLFGLVTHNLQTTLDAVEERVERREALADAESLAAATEAVEDEGGLTATETLLAATGDDRAALRAFEARAADLRERADAEVPLDAYRRLA